MRCLEPDYHQKARAQAADVKSRIEQALKRNAQVEADAIRVKVDGSKVTIEGKVRAWYKRDVAELAAWARMSFSE